MNVLIFTGRVAATPELESHGETKVTRFRLIRNEYAGKDDKGERRERQVSVPFTAFGRLAEMLADSVLVGDQLIVNAMIRNNNYTEARAWNGMTTTLKPKRSNSVRRGRKSAKNWR